jgi:hypothetical protein
MRHCGRGAIPRSLSTQARRLDREEVRWLLQALQFRSALFDVALGAVAEHCMRHFRRAHHLLRRSADGDVVAMTREAARRASLIDRVRHNGRRTLERAATTPGGERFAQPLFASLGLGERVNRWLF